MAGLFGSGKRKNDRRYPGIRGRRPDNKSFRIKDAAERKEAYSKLSNTEKLDKLDAKLGKDIGATKQRAKLMPKQEEQKDV